MGSQGSTGQLGSLGSSSLNAVNPKFHVNWAAAISLIIYCFVLISWALGSPNRANSVLWGREDISLRTQCLGGRVV